MLLVSVHIHKAFDDLYFAVYHVCGGRPATFPCFLRSGLHFDSNEHYPTKFSTCCNILRLLINTQESSKFLYSNDHINGCITSHRMSKLHQNFKDVEFPLSMS